MFGLQVAAEWQPTVAIVIILVMFALFIWEKIPVEVTAMLGAAVMIVLGLLPLGEATDVLKNSAPWTIAVLFLVMGGLVRTGAVEMIVSMAGSRAAQHPAATIAVLFGFIALCSSVMNNTPLVAVMIPVIIRLAGQMSLAPSKLLIPLSFMTVLGGMISLIGTSTNVLVDGVARDQGLEPFHLFEIAPLGLAITIIGGIYLGTVGRHLLPSRESMSALLQDRKKMKYFTEVAIPEGSPLIGRAPLEVEMFKRQGVRVIDVLRGDASLRRDMAPVRLEVGDRVVLRTEMAELMGLQERKDVKLVDRLSSVKTETVEVLIGPGCKLIDQRLGDMRLRRRYGVYVLAAHRRDQNIGAKLDDMEVRVGDTLLLEGAVEDIQRLAADMNMVDITRPSTRAFRRNKAPIAIMALVLIVGLSAFEVAPILILAFLGVVIILVTRCVDSDEAFNFVDGRLLAMIFAMLAVGQGLEHSGAVELIVQYSVPWLQGLSPFWTILAVYMLGMILTEFLSNNAVAVIYTPVAIELAHQLGVDPRGFVVAVMFSATVAFATPVGYQTNLMVYGPGGYRFSDFTKVGLPLNLICALVCALLIPVIWPLYPVAP